VGHRPPPEGVLSKMVDQLVLSESSPGPGVTPEFPFLMFQIVG